MAETEPLQRVLQLGQIIKEKVETENQQYSFKMLELAEKKKDLEANHRQTLLDLQAQCRAETGHKYPYAFGLGICDYCGAFQ